MIGKALVQGALVLVAVNAAQAETIKHHIYGLEPGKNPERTMAETSDSPNIMDDKTLLAALQVKLEKADAEMAKQNWAIANALLNEALADLGDRYESPEVLDHTGTKLVVADIQESEGKPDNAARVRRRMLAIRMDILRNKIH